MGGGGGGLDVGFKLIEAFDACGVRFRIWRLGPGISWHDLAFCIAVFIGKMLQVPSS